MRIDEVPNYIRNDIKHTTKSVNRFSMIFIFFDLVVCFFCVIFGQSFFANMTYWVDLVQALLVVSTSVMAFTGLMIVEIKKTNVRVQQTDQFEI